MKRFWNFKCLKWLNSSNKLKNDLISLVVQKQIFYFKRFFDLWTTLFQHFYLNYACWITLFCLHFRYWVFPIISLRIEQFLLTAMSCSTMYVIYRRVPAIKCKRTRFSITENRWRILVAILQQVSPQTS